MLTGPLVRVRYARDRILPYFIDPANEEWREVAEQLRDLFLAHQGRTRGEVEAAIDEMFGDDNDTLVQRGLAKLLEDRCGFETAPGLPPEQLPSASGMSNYSRKVLGRKRSNIWKSLNRCAQTQRKSWPDLQGFTE